MKAAPARPRLSITTAAAAICAGGVMATVPASYAAPPRWTPPLRPLAVARGYDPPAHDWLPGHRGVDLRAHLGQQVHSAGPGRVTFAASLAGRGVVVVDHGALRTTYEPVAARVHRGDHVERGQPVGVIAAGSGHCGSGNCLHFGVKLGSSYIDPRFLLSGYISVLRPVG